MIALDSVTRKFADLTAVDGLTLDVWPGELFGLLGANGAGKTTTIRMMCGLSQPDSGRVRVGGLDMATDTVEAKKLCSYVPDEPFLYDYLTALEFLRFVSELRQVDRAVAETNIRKYVDVFDLAPYTDRPIEGYSHGMRQKVALCAALLPNPRVLFLDEPTVGLDPPSVRRLKETLAEHCAAGGTVVFSTHILEIAEHLCDRVAILDHGSLVAQGTVAEVTGAKSESSLEEVFLGLMEPVSVVMPGG